MAIDLAPFLEILIAVIIPAMLAYWQKTQKDEGTAFMDPGNTDVTKAPDYIPDSAFTMKPETEAEIIAGRSQEEIQTILSEIRKQEQAGVKAYTIKCDDGDEYVIEYGYILTRPSPPDTLPSPITPGDFDPKLHTAEESGFNEKGEYSRGLKMPEARIKNLLFNHTPEDQASMRKQIEEAESAGLRNYVVKFSGGLYQIESGIMVGSVRG